MDINMKDLDERIRGIDEALLALIPIALGSMSPELLEGAVAGLASVCGVLGPEGKRRVRAYVSSAIDINCGSDRERAEKLHYHLDAFSPSPRPRST